MVSGQRSNEFRFEIHELLSSNVGDTRENKNNLYMKPPFSVMQPEIEKQGKRYVRIVPWSSELKFHKICSNGCGEMALDDFLHEASFFNVAASN